MLQPSISTHAATLFPNSTDEAGTDDELTELSEAGKINRNKSNEDTVCGHLPRGRRFTTGKRRRTALDLRSSTNMESYVHERRAAQVVKSCMGAYGILKETKTI